mmetsp:Transcript_11795/g.17302  ORF Transcript_11795/g.17302 Transcript_11795/m.17302 type:complete len:86 (+) Transcript_11795:2127-2384(+)
MPFNLIVSVSVTLINDKNVGFASVEGSGVGKGSSPSSDLTRLTGSNKHQKKIIDIDILRHTPTRPWIILQLFRVDTTKVVISKIA